MADLAPDEHVLRVRGTAALGRAAAVEVDDADLARGREGEESAVVPTKEGLRVLRVEGEPVHGGGVAVASAMIEQSPGCNRGSYDGVTWRVRR